MGETRGSIRPSPGTRASLPRAGRRKTPGRVPFSGGKALNLASVRTDLDRLAKDVDAVVAKSDRGGEGNIPIYNDRGDFISTGQLRFVPEPSATGDDDQYYLLIEAERVGISGEDDPFEDWEAIYELDVDGTIRARTAIGVGETGTGVQTANWQLLDNSGDLDFNGSINSNTPLSLEEDGDVEIGVSGQEVRVLGNLDHQGDTTRTIQTVTLAAAATTLAATNDMISVTPDGGGNTVASITGSNVGQIVYVRKVGGNSLTFTDSGSGASAHEFHLSADWVPGAGDTLVLARWTANNWIEISRTNNS